MNKTLKLLLAVFACCLGTSALAIEMTDTLVIENPNKVKIETRDTVQRIVISGSKDDAAFHYTQRISIPDTSAVRKNITSVRDFNKIKLSRSDKSKWSSSLHMNLGLGTMLDAPDPCKFKLWPSVDFGISYTMDYHPFGKKNVWSIGLGFNYSQYYSSDDYFWAKDAQKMLGLVPYGATQSERKTRLDVFSINVPLLYTHHFDVKKRWYVTVGALVNFNTGASARRFYEAPDANKNKEEYDVKTKSIGQRPVTIDGIVKLGNPFLPVYCKYCPMTFFKDGRGPKMHQLSFGFCF